MTLNDKMSSGGSGSLVFVDGMNDTFVTEGLGIAVEVNKIKHNSKIGH